MGSLFNFQKSSPRRREVGTRPGGGGRAPLCDATEEVIIIIIPFRCLCVCVCEGDDNSDPDSFRFT